MQFARPVSNWLSGDIVCGITVLWEKQAEADYKLRRSANIWGAHAHRHGLELGLILFPKDFVPHRLPAEKQAAQSRSP